MSKSNKILNSIIGILLIIGISVVIIKNKIIPIETIQHISVNDWHVIVSIITLISSLAITKTAIIWNQSQNIDTAMIIKDATRNIIISILSFGILYALFGNPQITFSINILVFNALNDTISSGHAYDPDMDIEENIGTSISFIFMILAIAGMISLFIATSMSDKAFNKTLFINSNLILNNIGFTLLNITDIIKNKPELEKINKNSQISNSRNT